jgi:hypothetical protein
MSFPHFSLRPHRARLWAGLLLTGSLALKTDLAYAEYTLYEAGDSSFDVSADLRLRLENDWDSRQGDGSERDDRLRLRTRVRVKFDAQIDEHWKVVVRLRSGSKDSQQSPHFTIYDFDDNDKGDNDLNVDQWFGQFQSGALTIWAGRNQLDFWRQDQFIMDDDVTAVGAGIRYKHGAGDGSIAWKTSFGSLPAGMRAFSGNYLAGQVVYERDTETHGITLAAGFFGVDADPDDPTGLRLLLTDNSLRDYSTGILQAQLRLRAFGKPLKLAATAGHNFQNYDDEPIDSFSEFHKDDRDFFIGFLNWGSAEKSGDWLLGYYYQYVEALAFSSSYGPDDWVRWGSATQTRATNMKGSEFRAVYTVADNMNIVGRLFLVDAIELLNAGDLSKEDGKRARIDFNIKF